MRNIESYFNSERSEFVQVIDFRIGSIKLLTWDKYHEVCEKSYIKRFPFRSELVGDTEMRKDYLDLHEMNKPYGMNFWEFLIDNKIKEDFCEYESKRYQNALLKWFEDNKVFSSLELDVYLQD